MTTKSRTRAEAYHGFEQGPIRPPSEAESLLIRVTRNCPWNHCRFCPVYKGTRFSLRPLDHVIEDIEQVHRYVSAIREAAGDRGRLTPEDVSRIGEAVRPSDNAAFQAALHWLAGRRQSIFLQDANSLVIKPNDLKAVLEHLRRRFPWVTRVTSYARSHTIARMALPDLQALAAAGLNRIHIGLESGADAVLKRMRKGTTRAGQIKAGLKAKAAGMELSEYVMPGLGGRELSRIHALETAEALNRINPDFIRLRTLAIPNHTDLADDRDRGRFKKLSDKETAEEVLLFLEHLNGITSMVKSDHILNLFQEVEGRLPEDRAVMTGVIRAFLSLPPEEQVIFQAGRRLGLLARFSDLEIPSRRRRAEQAVESYGIRPENVDTVVDAIMKRFV
ncbi:MAG: radical SAM protein [Desulfosarcina sp.]|nr:radical SAM protein [Desulfobacterales bacterium]